jgi:predicted metallopeptidase
MSQHKSCDVIDFSSRVKKYRETIKTSANEDLIELLSSANNFQQNIPLLRNGFNSLAQEEIKNIIHASLVIELRKSGNLNYSSLICATYAANLLMQLFCKTIKYWSALDFLNSEKKEMGDVFDVCDIKNGADVCFLISSYFTEKDEGWRTLKLRYYKNTGTSLYLNFYSQTKVDTGLYMSENFLLISNTVNKYLKTLQYHC